MRKLKEYIDESLKDQEKMFAQEFQKQKEEAAKSKSKDLDPDFVYSLRRVIINGFIVNEYDHKIKYGVSKENFFEVVDPSEVSKEQLKKIVDELKRKLGRDPWRFNKNEEYRSKGYQDPPKSNEEYEAAKKSNEKKSNAKKSNVETGPHGVKKIKTTDPNKLFENFKKIIEYIQSIKFDDSLKLRIELGGQEEGGISDCRLGFYDTVYLYTYDKKGMIDPTKLTMNKSNEVRYDNKIIHGTNCGSVEMSDKCLYELFIVFNWKKNDNSNYDKAFEFSRKFAKAITGRDSCNIGFYDIIDEPNKILDTYNKIK